MTSLVITKLIKVAARAECAAEMFSRIFLLGAGDDGERRELNYGEQKRGENIKNGETAAGVRAHQPLLQMCDDFC